MTFERKRFAEFDDQIGSPVLSSSRHFCWPDYGGHDVGVQLTDSPDGAVLGVVLDTVGVVDRLLDPFQDLGLQAVHLQEVGSDQDLLGHHLVRVAQLVLVDELLHHRQGLGGHFLRV